MCFRLAVYVTQIIVNSFVVHFKPASLQIVFELIFKPILIAFVYKTLAFSPDNFEN